MIDNVLNKTLDYDARILNPECFSILAARLDLVVEEVVLKMLHVIELANLERKVGAGSLSGAPSNLRLCHSRTDRRDRRSFLK